MESLGQDESTNAVDIPPLSTEAYFQERCNTSCEEAENLQKGRFKLLQSQHADTKTIEQTFMKMSPKIGMKGLDLIDASYSINIPISSVARAISFPREVKCKSVSPPKIACEDKMVSSPIKPQCQTSFVKCSDMGNENNHVSQRSIQHQQLTWDRAKRQETFELYKIAIQHEWKRDVRKKMVKICEQSKTLPTCVQNPISRYRLPNAAFEIFQRVEDRRKEEKSYPSGFEDFDNFQEQLRQSFGVGSSEALQCLRDLIEGFLSRFRSGSKIHQIEDLEVLWKSLAWSKNIWHHVTIQCGDFDITEETDGVHKIQMSQTSQWVSILCVLLATNYRMPQLEVIFYEQILCVLDHVVHTGKLDSADLQYGGVFGMLRRVIQTSGKLSVQLLNYLLNIVVVGCDNFDACECATNYSGNDCFGRALAKRLAECFRATSCKQRGSSLVLSFIPYLRKMINMECVNRKKNLKPEDPREGEFVTSDRPAQTMEKEDNATSESQYKCISELFHIGLRMLIQLQNWDVKGNMMLHAADVNVKSVANYPDRQIGGKSFDLVIINGMTFMEFCSELDFFFDILSPEALHNLVSFLAGCQSACTSRRQQLWLEEKNATEKMDTDLKEELSCDSKVTDTDMSLIFPYDGQPGKSDTTKNLELNTSEFVKEQARWVRQLLTK